METQCLRLKQQRNIIIYQLIQRNMDCSNARKENKQTRTHWGVTLWEGQRAQHDDNDDDTNPNNHTDNKSHDSSNHNNQARKTKDNEWNTPAQTNNYEQSKQTRQPTNPSPPTKCPIRLAKAHQQMETTQRKQVTPTSTAVLLARAGRGWSGSWRSADWHWHPSPSLTGNKQSRGKNTWTSSKQDVWDKTQSKGGMKLKQANGITEEQANARLTLRRHWPPLSAKTKEMAGKASKPLKQTHKDKHRETKLWSNFKRRTRRRRSNQAI